MAFLSYVIWTAVVFEMCRFCAVYACEPWASAECVKISNAMIHILSWWASEFFQRVFNLVCTKWDWRTGFWFLCFRWFETCFESHIQSLNVKCFEIPQNACWRRTRWSAPNTIWARPKIPKILWNYQASPEKAPKHLRSIRPVLVEPFSKFFKWAFFGGQEKAVFYQRFFGLFEFFFGYSRSFIKFF